MGQALHYLRISEIQAGTVLNRAVFIAIAPTLRNKKDGGNFAEVRLRDGSATIKAVQWDNLTAFETGLIKDESFVEVNGEVFSYNGQLQVRLHKIAPVSDADVDDSWFLPTSSRSTDSMLQELDRAIEAIEDPDYRRLVTSILSEPEFRARFAKAPGAISMHHAYLGGLLEHTLSVRRNALLLARNYPSANKCLLGAGALLHDIGKTSEYSWNRRLARTDTGDLLHHIPIGVAVVEVHCSRFDAFPPEKKVLIQHLIVSHHGLLEFSSPSEPRTLEALLLHHADQLDAQAQNFLEAVANAQRTGSRWELLRMFDRRMFIGAGDGEVTGADTISLAYGQYTPSEHQSVNATRSEEEDSVDPKDDSAS